VQVNNGLTNIWVNALTVSETDIFAGTYGAGVWRRPLSELVSVSKEANYLPLDYSLSQNYPNPFNPSTTIQYQLPQSGKVTLNVYDILGREVAFLVNDFKPAGSYSVTFNASALPTGIYIYKLEAAPFSQTKKMLLLK